MEILNTSNMDLCLDWGKILVFGVLTLNDTSQTLDRAGHS